MTPQTLANRQEGIEETRKGADKSKLIIIWTCCSLKTLTSRAPSHHRIVIRVDAAAAAAASGC